MSDNPKKKKLDAKRVALGQKHEIAYLNKMARKIAKGEPVYHSTIIKLAKAWLKLVKKLK